MAAHKNVVKIEPCPFCGMSVGLAGSANDEDGVSVYCMACLASGSAHFGYQAEDLAVLCWNAIATAKTEKEKVISGIVNTVIGHVERRLKLLHEYSAKNETEQIEVKARIDCLESLALNIAVDHDPKPSAESTKPRPEPSVPDNLYHLPIRGKKNG